MVRYYTRLFYTCYSKYLLVTRDADFIQLEGRFNENAKVAEKLRQEGQIFRDSVSGNFFFIHAAKKYTKHKFFL